MGWIGGWCSKYMMERRVILYVHFQLNIIQYAINKVDSECKLIDLSIDSVQLREGEASACSQESHPPTTYDRAYSNCFVTVF